MQAMIRKMDVQTVPAILYTANLHRLDDLKKEAIEYINDHAKSVMESDKWQQYILDNPLLLEQLYKSLVSKTCKPL